MLRVPAEFQDVPLRDPGMLQKLPAGVRQSRDKCPALRFRKAFHGIYEMHVRPAPFQEEDEMFAQCFIMVT